MRTEAVRRLLLAILCAGLAAPAAPAQTAAERLPRDVFDVIAPTERVFGSRRKGFGVAQPGCRVGPLGPHTRRRIVDIAVQEWAVFGFQTLDMASTETHALPATDAIEIVPPALNPVLEEARLARRSLRLGRWEDEDEVVASVAGYWSATPDGAEVLRKQNAAWGSPWGDSIGWLEPWSAAFVSWVMCEAGLGERDTFRRSIAHWEYVDQAIAAREAPGRAAYVARDLGEAEVVPGDLLCNARGEARYRTLADRRAELGVYAPLHCDLVVKTDGAQDVILVIGGNVLNSVSLSVLKAEAVDGRLAPVAEDRLEGARRWFAHLQLQTGAIEAQALEASPTVRRLRERRQASGIR